jgi:pilus assembly protein CpaE
LRDMYSYIVVDLGNWLDEFFLQVCTEADMVLLLTQFTIPDVKNLEIFLHMLKERDFNRHNLKIVVNRYISRHVVQLGDLPNIINHPAFHTLPSDYFSSMNAIDMGTILSRAAPRSNLWGSIKRLGEKILEEIGK